MGYLPKLSEIDRDRDMIRKFSGINHNEVIDDGQFYEMENLSSDSYPVLTTRKERTLCKTLGAPSRIAAGEHMAWIEGGQFYYNGAAKFEIDMSTAGGTLYDQVQMVRMGAYICIFPHGIVYNTSDDTVTKIKATVEGTSKMKIFPTIEKIDASGSSSYSTIDYVASDTEPTDTSKYWLDTGSSPTVLKQYSKDFKVWVSVPTSLLHFWQLSDEGIPYGAFSKAFKSGDAVTISGLTGDLAELNGSFIIRAATLLGFVIEVNTFPLNLPGDDGVTIQIKVERTFPYMDFVCESGNRLFGCSSSNHEIYASKLGDPLNWNVFSGISTDSYAATVGTPGEFTGVSAYQSTVLFFKENVIHILSGTRPANFQIDTIECRGMQRLSYKSPKVVNEVLLYKSDSGIMAYDGDLPELVSEAFGEYNSGHVIAAGTDGKKYYCCLMTDDDKCHVMVLDTIRGIWSREDGTSVRDFAAIGNELYMLDMNGGIYDLNTGTNAEVNGEWKDTEQATETNIAWSATTGAIGLDSPYEKYIAALLIRVQMENGSNIRVELSYDEENNFVEVGRITADRLRSVTLNIVPRRCDTMRIRLSGRGKFKLYSLSKEVETGGYGNGGI